MAGRQIAGGYVGVLHGIQGDQDFIRILMNPTRSIAEAVFCFAPI